MALICSNVFHAPSTFTKGNNSNEYFIWFSLWNCSFIFFIDLHAALNAWVLFINCIIDWIKFLDTCFSIAPISANCLLNRSTLDESLSKETLSARLVSSANPFISFSKFNELFHLSNVFMEACTFFSNCAESNCFLATCLSINLSIRILPPIMRFIKK